jgi:uncharacterized OB-fold protein
VDDDNRAFWEAGGDGVLRFSSCRICGALLHPPVPVCRYCRSDDIGIRDVSGRATVVGVTINHHPWDTRFPPPYAIGTVAIDEDPRVRLVTNLIDVDPDQARVGMRVAVVFEHHEDVWIPLFAPIDEADGQLPVDETPPEDHRRWIRPMGAKPKFEEQAAITGIGMSDIGRRLMRPPLSLTVEAVQRPRADDAVG